ncbi:polysaccharide pyruvyl transferase family protein [Pseudaminobacter sp. NGMCC 1.201702]|uniref:polysaccharide pyruvyl transferase family protein n=1 Tax=Pseudaminobacter sp. NGMCC 1.201702 TaxID=3391825 RepID=UPI0039EF70D0
MSPPQKIGVLTFHRCINYGSYWQARCLVEGLRARGQEAVLLDHDSRSVNRAEWKCALQPLLPVPTPKSDYPLYALKTRRFFDAFATLPVSAPFTLDDPDNMDDYDLVIVGSDEVWNQRHPWYGGYRLFYGEGLKTERLASYAASFGNHPASDGLDHERVAMLRKFAGISIRDENSRRIVQDALDYEPELVLDPCLQFPGEITASHKEAHRPYVALYGHSFPDWFQQSLRNWAASHGYRLASIGYRNDWADEQWITAGPEDFAGFMSKAEAVATNFFHGCIFALLNEKPFVCAASDYRLSKVQDLASMVGAENHLVSQATPQAHYAQILEQALEPEISMRIAALRQRSEAYLNGLLH